MDSTDPGWGRSPGGGHGNPLLYSCRENPHGQRTLVSYSTWACKELDMAERLSTTEQCTPYTVLYYGINLYLAHGRSQHTGLYIPIYIWITHTYIKLHICCYSVTQSCPILVMLYPLGLSMLSKMARFHSSLWMSSIHVCVCVCVCIPHLFCPSIYWWTLRLLPYLGYCK